MTDLVVCACSDPAHPVLAGRVWLGGSVRKGGGVRVVSGLPDDMPEAPEVPTVQGHELLGGPQMIQLRCAHASTRASKSLLCHRRIWSSVTMFFSSLQQCEQWST